jgi:hypothetical protein
VRLGPTIASFSGDGVALEDHHSWGQPVYATAAGGKVAAVIYDMPDLAPGAPPDPRMFRNDPRRLLGNAVAVSHGNGEFSYYGAVAASQPGRQRGPGDPRGALLGAWATAACRQGRTCIFTWPKGRTPLSTRGCPCAVQSFLRPAANGLNSR